MTAAAQFMLAAAALSSSACWKSGPNPNDANPVSDYEREFNEPKEDKPVGVYLPNTEAETELLVEAMRLYDRGLFSRAKEEFLKLEQRYPTSYYAPLADLKTADSLFFLGNPQEALPLYEEFLQLRPKHEATPYVQFQIARAYHLQYKGIKNDQAPLRTAIANYEKVITNHASSEFAPLARRQIHECRKALAEHELLVAEFYLKTEQHKAAANRLRILAADYADTPSGLRARSELASLLADHPELQELVRAKAESLRDATKAKSLVPSQPAIVSASHRGQAAGDTELTVGEYQRSMLLTTASATTPASTASAAGENGNPSGDRTPAPPTTIPAQRVYASTLLDGLSCEESAGVSVFTARLNGSARLELTESDLTELAAVGGQGLATVEPLTVRALIKGQTSSKGDRGQSGSEHAAIANGSKSRDLSCETKFASLAVETDERSARLSLAREADTKYHLFTLDRPHRLVAIVQRKSIN